MHRRRRLGAVIGLRGGAGKNRQSIKRILRESLACNNLASAAVSWLKSPSGSIRRRRSTCGFASSATLIVMELEPLSPCAKTIESRLMERRRRTMEEELGTDAAAR